MNVYQKLMDDSIARTIKIKRSGERPGWETDKSRHWINWLKIIICIFYVFCVYFYHLYLKNHY